MKIRQNLIVLTLLFASLFANINAQTTTKQKTKLKPLTVGDKVPEIVFSQVFNYVSKKANLSQLKSKLTILDFWSSSCTSCIKLFPHMQELNDRFKGKLQIILVNSKTSLWKDDETKTKMILNTLRNKTNSEIRLPIIFNSQELDAYFPWKTIPHEIWIDSIGRIIAITGSDEVRAENISKILSGQKIALRKKQDIFFDIGMRTLSELVYSLKPENVRQFGSSILVRGFIDGLNTNGFRSSSKDTLYTGFLFTNRPALEMYKEAFEKLSYSSNRIIVETAHQDVFSIPKYGDPLDYSNVYSYDLNVSPSSRAKIIQYVQSDLERYFGVTLRNQRRNVGCLIVYKCNDLDSLKTKNQETQMDIDKGTIKKFFHGYSVKDVLKTFDRFFDKPLINETGISDQKIDINFRDNFDPSNQHAVIDFLKSIGFEIKEEERELDVVVITDKPQVTGRR